MFSRPPSGGGWVCAIRVAAIVLGAFSTGLQAQQPYLTGTGQSSLFATFDPNAPPAKAPVAGPISFTQPFLPTLPPDQYDAIKAEVAKNVLYSFPGPAEVQTTPVPRAPSIPAPLVAAPTLSWEGIADTQLQPPSPDIAVGPNDVVVVVNSAIAQYTRTGTLKKSTPFTTFFSALAPAICPSACIIYDPSIRYDQMHGRFLFLATATTTDHTRSALLLSISNGATYDSGWTTWGLNAMFDGPTLTTNWGDFWRMGFDNAAVYLSGNMYNPLSQFQYAKVRVLSKAALYNPATTTLTFSDLFNLQNADQSIASSLDPVHQRGKPTAINASYFVNATTKPPATFLTVWKIADPLANPPVLTRSTVTHLLSYNIPAPAPQPTVLATLDTGDTRLLKAVYRNGFIYTARDSGYTDAAITVTYDVIDTSTMTAASQARLMNMNAFYPAFDVPATVPSGVQFASGNMVVGTVTAPDGTLTYPGLSNGLKAGEDIFSVAFNGTSRWGDYFGGAVDPVSGGLWVYGEYAKPAFAGGFGQWGTWAGYYPWLTASTFTDVPSTSFYSDFINVLALWKVSLGCTATAFCPGDQVSRGQVAAFVIRAMYGDTFTYTTTPYFTDVPATYPFFSYIQKLRDLGIIHGCTPTAYCPDSPIVRMDAATIIVRAKLESLFGDNFPYSTTPVFTDVPSSFSQFPYVQKLYELGITSGCTPTLFCPNSNLTRQEIAVFLTRAFLN